MNNYQTAVQIQESIKVREREGEYKGEGEVKSDKMTNHSTCNVLLAQLKANGELRD